MDDWEDIEGDKRKKRGYTSFFNYLRKADRTCRQINQLDNWGDKLKLADDLIEDLPKLLENFGDLLSKTVQKELEEMLDFSKIYTKVPLGSCAKLIEKIQKAVDELNIQIQSPIQNDPSISNSSMSTTTSASVGTSSSISPVLIASIVIAVVAAAGIGGTCALGIFICVDPGNESESSGDIIPEIKNPVDLQPPILVSPDNNSSFEKGQGPTLKWKSSETNIIFLVQVTNKNTGTPENQDVEGKSFSTTNLDIGEYSWRVKAVDNAGNKSEFSDLFNFTIFQPIIKIPKPTLISPENLKIQTGNKVDFLWNVSDLRGIDHYTIEVYSVDNQLKIRENKADVFHSSNFDEGNYKWQVRAVDESNRAGLFSDPFFFSIGIQTFSPTACFEVITDIPQMETPVNFNASCSDDDGIISSYIWDFGDGVTSSGITINHTYQLSGDYFVTLTVTDNNGEKDTISNLVKIDPKPIPNTPNAVISIPALIHKMGTQIDFSASESTDLDDDIINYLWHFGGQNIAFGKTASHTYYSVGPQTIKLTVSDSQGLTDTETIIIDIVPPFTNISWLENVFYSSSGQIKVNGDNLDPDIIDIFTMRVWSDSDSTGIEIVIMEDEPNTNILTGAVGFVTTLSNSEQGDLAIGCNDNVYAGYIENQLPNSWSSNKKSNYLAKSQIGCIR